MKLTELNPRWVKGSRWDDPDGAQHYIYEGNHNDHRTPMGMSFDCPVHRNHRIAIFFANPLDGLPPEHGANHWKREGETFETISLSPSINVEFKGCWHGYITNGEVS